MSDSPSDTPRIGRPAQGPAGETVRSDVGLRGVVDPSDVRRAPRYGRFLGAGAFLGLVLGVVLGLIFLQTPEAEAMLKPGVYFVVITAFIVTFTTLAAGLLAILADRRSLRRRRAPGGARTGR